MPRKKKCVLLLHGSYKEINAETFESVSAAKKWVSECWDRPFTIKTI